MLSTEIKRKTLEYFAEFDPLDTSFCDWMKDRYPSNYKAIFGYRGKDSLRDLVALRKSVEDYRSKIPKYPNIRRGVMEFWIQNTSGVKDY